MLANDRDPVGDPLRAVIVTPTSHGSIALGTNGAFIYFSTSGYVGLDSFTYRASDGSLTSNLATVTFNVHLVSGSEATAGTAGRAEGLRIVPSR